MEGAKQGLGIVLVNDTSEREKAFKQSGKKNVDGLYAEICTLELSRSS